LTSAGQSEGQRTPGRPVGLDKLGFILKFEVISEFVALEH
jgi:hypothetical protein